MTITFKVYRKANKIKKSLQDTPIKAKTLPMRLKCAICDADVYLPSDDLKDLSSHGSKRFQLQKLLDTGGMCDIYLALDLARVAWSDTAPQVVIKRLLADVAHNAQAKTALAHEFFTLRHLAHPGVVRVFDLHMQDDDLYISMEYLQGDNLYNTLAAYPNGMGDTALTLSIQLLHTLEYLHSKGVVHGDIKPANLMLTHEGRLALLDFNMARVQQRAGTASSAISQGLRESLHLPSYSLLHASPERLQGKTPSQQDDIYSTCCTIYEMLTGKHPFTLLSSQEAQEKKLAPKRPAHCSSRIWQALQAGLSFDSSRRPSIEALREVFSPGRSFFTDMINIFRKHP